MLIFLIFKNHCYQRYLVKKSLGQQTCLDLCLMDGIKIWILRIFCFNLNFYLGLFYGQVNIILGKILLCLHSITLQSQLACLQIALILKAIMIFKMEFLGGLPDKIINRGYRVATVIYTILIVVANRIYSIPISPFMFEKMIGSKELT